MKKNFLIFALLLMAVCYTGCTEEEEKSDALQAFSNSGCKNYATRSESAVDSWSDLFGKESITYEGTKDGCLMLYHNNVLFTCETEISAKVTIKDGEISIVESYNPNTNCICAYDLFLKIGPLEHRAYTISIYHNISSTLFETAYISFPINYSTNIKGNIDIIDKGDIVGTWKLKGWGNDNIFTTFTRGYLTFSPDGTLTGKGTRNQIYGHYICQGDKIEMHYGGTKIGYTNDEDAFFEDNLRNVTKYSFTKKGDLRLYYSIDEYFELTLIQL